MFKLANFLLLYILGPRFHVISIESAWPTVGIQTHGLRLPQGPTAALSL